MLNELKAVQNITYTENGAEAYRSTNSACLDLFALAGALRNKCGPAILKSFIRAYAENPDDAMRILFYARDIRGGLGERRFFRIILRYLAGNYPESVLKNIVNVPEYGRYDDLIQLLDTPCEEKMIEFIRKQLDEDTDNMNCGKPVSLLAKWLPSVNTSNYGKREQAKCICRLLHISEKEYRKKLSSLRGYIDILETRLCGRDYTFDYEKQPSKALYKYRKAFVRNDGERYMNFINAADKGDAVLNASTLYPYEIVRSCQESCDEQARKVLDVTWKSLPDYTNDSDALVVVDGSGSMYCSSQNGIMPIDVAVSLGIYFAERNKGAFRGHFITFSENPRLISIKGDDIYSKAKFCMSYNEVANTDVAKVFALILQTAIYNKVPQEQLPSTIYIISDMEFDCCCYGTGVGVYNKMRNMYRNYGYELPTVVFWNVYSHREHFPVMADEAGTVLVSGCSPSIFSMVMSKDLTPESYMRSILDSERYRKITA